MNTKIESLHYNAGGFSGELFSQFFQAVIGFDGNVTFNSSEDEIEITELTFAEEMPDYEHAFLKLIIEQELAQSYTGEIYSLWQEDAYDAHQMHLEDEKTGN